MPAPDDRRYLESHEWHKPEGGLVVIGLSQFAVEELTDITYVEISKQDGAIEANEPFGEIESVKATSELYCGVAGEVVEVNQAVIDNPALVNEDPYGKAWLIKVKPSDTGALEGLMSAEAYEKQQPGPLATPPAADPRWAADREDHPAPADAQCPGGAPDLLE